MEPNVLDHRGLLAAAPCCHLISALNVFVVLAVHMGLFR